MLSLPHLNYKVINSITQLPITNGALYAFDIDDTLIKRKTKFIPIFTTEKPEYKRIYYSVNQDDIDHLRKISEVATVIYITARDIEDIELTFQQFKEFNIPLSNNESIYFSTLKYKSLIDFGYDRYQTVYFIDDLDINCNSVTKNIPNVICCRIDKVLYDRLKGRRNVKSV